MPAPENSTNSPDSTWAARQFKLTITDNPYLGNVEVSPAQFLFLTYPAPEVFYGGAAGGGKSWALLLAAMQYVSVPGYNAILFRRTFTDLALPDGLIAMSHDLLGGTDAVWNGQDHRWNFPSGATLSFGYIASENDKFRYKSSAFAFVGFDELTQFTESQYRYLFSRLRRRTTVNVPLRTRSASNPGDVGHQWVYDRFVNPALSRPAGCVFVRAVKTDNPWLDQAAYDESLAKLDHLTRRQLRDGDWTIKPEGNAFHAGWFKRYSRDGNGNYILPDARIIAENDCTRFASADIAGTEKRSGNDPDFTVIQIWDLSPRGDLFLVDQLRGQFEIPDVETKLVDLAWRRNVQFCAIEKNGIGLPVVQTARRRGLNVRAIVSKRNKFARAQGAMIRAEAGGIFFPSGAPWVDDLESELLVFPTEGAHDDQVDALSIAAQQAQRIAGPVESEADQARRDNADAVEAEEVTRERTEQKEAAFSAARAFRSGETDESWLVAFDQD